MRVVVALVIGLIGAGARPARADDVDDLVARGEELGKQAEWSRAIDAFKAADAKRPRAKHACLIGLAYTRRELWAEAELFLSICRQRASSTDPLPDWAEEARQQLVAKLAASNAAPVTITVKPANVAALVTVSSFAPGETFTPRTIHLAPGAHVITVTAPGYKPAKRDVTIETNFPQDVTVSLESDGYKPPPPGWIPYAIIAAGGVVLAGGLAYDLAVFEPAADDLGNNNTAFGYYTQLDAVRTKRDVAIGLVAGGAATIAIGAVLKLTLFRAREAPVVGVAPQPGGGVITVGWAR